MTQEIQQMRRNGSLSLDIHLVKENRAHRISFSKLLTLAVGMGAKAEAEPTRATRQAAENFMV
jgi:hypothetical protein